MEVQVPLSEYRTEPDTAGQHPSISLPLNFQIYCSKARIPRSFLYIGRESHSIFYIGHETKPLYAISVGYSGLANKKVTLHGGPSVDSKALGTSILKRKLMEISVPGASTQMTRRLTRVPQYIFDLPTVPGDKGESFAWRRFHEKDQGIDQFETAGQSSTWELFRIHNPHSCMEEVVAIYSVDISSPTLFAEFRFIGSGASYEFDKEWVVMTVLTALSLGQKQRDKAMKEKQRHSSGAVMGLTTSVG